MRQIYTLIVLFIIVLLSPFQAQARPKVTLATTTWAPYVSAKKDYHGYAFDIVKAAFEQAGYDVEIKFMPWDKAVVAVRHGKIDGIFPEYFSSNFQHEIVYSEPFSGGPIGLYKRRNSGIHFPLADPAEHQKEVFDAFAHYKFGVVTGYNNVPAFDSDTDLQKIAVGSDADNLRQLYQGKVQLIIIDKFAADDLIAHKLGPKYADALTFMEPALGYKKLYLGLSKKLPNSYRLLADFNEGLQAIKKNGVMASILDKDAKKTGNLYA